MRGSFNRTGDLYYGPRSLAGPPGVMYASDVSCRLVKQVHIDQEQFPFDLTDYWLTLDELEPHGPLTTSPELGSVYTDYYASDEVIVHDDDQGACLMVRKEMVGPIDSPLYWRCLLLPLSKVVI